MPVTKTIPMVDIFAGPGGLSEGFSRYSDWTGDPSTRFRSVLSIEKDEVAVRTLTLRTFYRQFEGELPEEYWKVIRGEANVETLKVFPEWKTAERHVWKAELGKVAISDLHDRIELRLKSAEDWLLIGGPPCQAYSLMGRARMTGIGFDAKSDVETAETTRKERLLKFHGDVRHVLYREYLRIIAVHQPTVFVMENVKGILSARLPDEDGKPEFMFDRIRADLKDPWAALEDDEDIAQLRAMARDGRPRYRLHALTTEVGDLLGDEPANSDFLIRSEKFGVPQKRHRVIVVGIREDHPGVPGTLKHAASTTVRDAIGNMPALRSGISRGADAEPDWLAQRSAAAKTLISSGLPEDVTKVLQGVRDLEGAPGTRGAAYVRSVPGKRRDSVLDAWLSSLELQGFVQHESRSHMVSDLARYLFASVSTAALGRTPKLGVWPVDLLPKHRNVAVDSQGTVQAADFADRFKVQAWDEPSSTVTSHIAKDGHYFIHPDPAQNRSLTVREAARIQTFPDDYFFCGNRTEQYHQVGNAVPPLLAVQLARCVAVLFADVLPVEAPLERKVAYG